MDTIGSLFDKLCILEKRMTVVDKETLELLEEQRSWILYEIGKVLVQTFDFQRPAKFLKHKQYDKDVEGVENTLFLSAIEELRNQNHNLWELEDLRRDKENYLPDERLEFADRVAIHNKLRNEAIDTIDKIIDMAVN